MARLEQLGDESTTMSNKHQTEKRKRRHARHSLGASSRQRRLAVESKLKIVSNLFTSIPNSLMPLLDSQNLLALCTNEDSDRLFYEAAGKLPGLLPVGERVEGNCVAVDLVGKIKSITECLGFGAGRTRSDQGAITEHKMDASQGRRLSNAIAAVKKRRNLPTGKGAKDDACFVSVDTAAGDEKAVVAALLSTHHMGLIPEGGACFKVPFVSAAGCHNSVLAFVESVALCSDLKASLRSLHRRPISSGDEACKNVGQKSSIDLEIAGLNEEMSAIEASLDEPDHEVMPAPDAPDLQGRTASHATESAGTLSDHDAAKHDADSTGIRSDHEAAKCAAIAGSSKAAAEPAGAHSCHDAAKCTEPCSDHDAAKCAADSTGSLSDHDAARRDADSSAADAAKRAAEPSAAEPAGRSSASADSADSSKVAAEPAVAHSYHDAAKCAEPCSDHDMAKRAADCLLALSLTMMRRSAPLTRQKQRAAIAGSSKAAAEPTGTHSCHDMAKRTEPTLIMTRQNVLPTLLALSLTVMWRNVMLTLLLLMRQNALLSLLLLSLLAAALPPMTQPTLPRLLLSLLVLALPALLALSLTMMRQSATLSQLVPTLPPPVPLSPPRLLPLMQKLSMLLGFAQRVSKMAPLTLSRLS